MIADATPLERLLEAATHEAGLRPEFYRHLLDAEVLVPIERELHPGDRAPSDSVIYVHCMTRVDRVSVIPFYSSPARVYEAGPATPKCAVMRVRELFALQPEMHFHLNPFSQFGREFPPHEVKALLARGTVVATPPHAIPFDTTTRMTQPANLPLGLLDGLKVLLSRRFQVKAAYVGELHRRAQTSLLIVLDTEGSIADLLTEMATIADDTRAMSCAVDVCEMPHDDSPIAEFVRHAQPFYERGWAARFMPAASGSPPSAS